MSHQSLDLKLLRGHARQLPNKAHSRPFAKTRCCYRIEAIIRNALNDGNYDRIDKIVHQLCHEYAYAVHQPHARNGGLIGLAAAAIALGPVRRNQQEKAQLFSRNGTIRGESKQKVHS